MPLGPGAVRGHPLPFSGCDKTAGDVDRASDAVEVTYIVRQRRLGAASKRSSVDQSRAGQQVLLAQVRQVASAVTLRIALLTGAAILHTVFAPPLPHSRRPKMKKHYVALSVLFLLALLLLPAAPARGVRFP